ncbi:hypothetical protein ACF8GB_10925 [Pseudomonas sp. xss_4]|uniref:hypothetical protein n=1 Tax=Pseudomonas TaxID=286 RepID=UPI002DBAA81E|nr:hypothetical protein [Pseudomonas fulva]MEC4025566.1 hypothetical protein [Pseudomonas fulva]
MPKLPSPAMPEERVRAALIMLLEQDSQVRRLVLDIVTPAAHEADVSLQVPPLPITELPAAAPEQPQDPLRAQLKEQLALLATFGADQELEAAWFHQGENEGQQLMRLLATAAQWERLLELWDLLAERCKAQERPASVVEQQILEGCLAIHNLIWRDRQAQLYNVLVGDEYDYRLHHRTTLRGERISAQWLPGLANAGGERQRLPLAAAE